MKKNNVYIKQFSEINDLQFKKIIKYNICEKNIGNSKIYGINISEHFEGKNNNETEFVSENYDLTLEILTFLYENSVGVYHFKEIIEDVLWKLEQKN